MTTAKDHIAPAPGRHTIVPGIDSSGPIFLVRCESPADAWCRRTGECMYPKFFSSDAFLYEFEGTNLARYCGPSSTLREGIIDFLSDGVDEDDNPQYQWFYRAPAPRRRRPRRWWPHRNPHGRTDQPWQQPGHFRAGDDVLHGAGDEWSPLRASADDVCNQQTMPGNAEFYRHANGCEACLTDVLGQRADAERARQADYESFAPAARELAARFDDALVLVEEGQCCSPNHYEMSPDADLPRWFTEALAGMCLRESECGWPGLARTWAPIDWPALIDAHPEFLAPLVNKQTTWPAICKAFGLLREKGYGTQLDVNILVDETRPGLQIWPTMLYADDLDPNTHHDTVAAITHILNPHDPDAVWPKPDPDRKTYEWDIGC
ncbi:hypothetical protein [Mycolicibacterium sp.]|uniref:hypothetical protein n=1 Tax=Mycolicibacterium sp. TaxID=2320850 RepID=UPI0037C85DC3